MELDVSRPIAEQGSFVAIVHKAVGDAGAPKLHAPSAHGGHARCHRHACHQAIPGRQARCSWTMPHRAEREARLQEYQRAHARVPIIDPVDHIRPLHDRTTMLGALSNGITILVGCTAV